MNYKLHITDLANNDLNEAADYIEFVLMNPQAADDLLDCVDEKISQLTYNATLYPVVDDPVLKTWGIRFVPVKNYLAFYIVSESEQTIFVIRFLYAKRNWFSILKHEITLACEQLKAEIQKGRDSVQTESDWISEEEMRRRIDLDK